MAPMQGYSNYTADGRTNYALEMANPQAVVAAGQWSQF